MSGWRNSGTGPCKGCPNAGCGAYHDECDKYLAWQKEQQEKHKAERDFKLSQVTISERTQKEMWRKLRYNRKSRPSR